jgi:SAM-dependent methyltransferase
MDGSPHQDHLEANRALWDEWTAIHATSDFYDVEAFKEEGLEPGRGMRLRAYEIEEVGPVAGKDLLHLQCHFGLDTLSWARLGARVTGADFSPEAITLARALAADVGIEADFVTSDIYELPKNLGGDFDVVYTSRGVLGWLPDLTGWAEVIAHYLRPGGVFYITEIHPFAQVFDDESAELKLRFHYFPRPEPLAFETKGSYADPDAHVKQPYEFSWQHSIGEIVTSLATAGLHIEFLRELPYAAWAIPFLEERTSDEWVLPKGTEGEIPLFFSLRATKA